VEGLQIIESGPGACRIRLRVRPGAGRSGIEGIHAGALKLTVNAPAERGKANEAVVRLLADALHVPRASVELVSGLSSREKVVEVSGLTAGELRTRLEQAVSLPRSLRRV
jgi:uncharacterized protein